MSNSSNDALVFGRIDCISNLCVENNICFTRGSLFIDLFDSYYYDGQKWIVLTRTLIDGLKFQTNQTQLTLF